MRNDTLNMTVTDNWRVRPLARAVVSMSCSLMLIVQSAPLYAASRVVIPADALPQAAANWVQAGNAGRSIIGNTLTVDQASNKAILNWESFNIGSDAAVQFNQPNAAAIALNRIGDASASQIFGRLGANGSIYLINNNGIVFGQGSQVNVHGLVASTLNIDANRFMKNSLTSAIDDGQAAFEGGSAVDAAIVVEGGASIATDSGGQVLMFAPHVVNGGDISTPDGQTILAATSDKVYLTTSNNDQDLRGLLVEVATGGDVTNVGQIVAERGNVTLLGLAVNQNGRVRATTSVDVNGSIRLLARDQAVPAETSYGNQQHVLLLDSPDELPDANRNVAVAQRTGTVSFGAGSVTEVVADTRLAADGSVPTAPDAQVQNRSRIDVMGKTIVVGDNATLRAKSGKINLTATLSPTADPNQTANRNDARIQIGNAALLDVSGENIELPMERRMVEVELRGDELKDSPLQRSGILRGKTVKVDVETGSPLIADLKPTLAKIRKDVRERSVTGGAINLRSQGDVVIGKDATLNMAGGSVTYQAGFLNTTKLLSADGRIVDIGSADPDRLYIGMFGEHSQTHPKWGKAIFGRDSIFSVGTWSDSYTEGRDAGALNIVTSALAGFDQASIRAGAPRSANQRALATMPKGGSITIALGVGTTGAAQDAVIDQLVRSALPGLDAPVTGAAYISAQRLNDSGLGRFVLTSDGRIAVTSDASVKLEAGSEFKLDGSAIEFAGHVRAPSGSVSLATHKPSASASTDDIQPLTIASGAVIDVSGNWINDLADTRRSAALVPLALNGGSIELTARGDLDFAAGAVLRANAGAQLSADGAFAGGSGGSIALSSRARSAADQGSVLTLLGDMQAYGYTKGGKLRLEANGIEIGADNTNGQPDRRFLTLDPIFFTQGGFSDYTLVSNLIGLSVAPQVELTPKQQNWVVSDLSQLVRVGTGGDISPLRKTLTLRDYERNPTGLHLSAVQSVNTNNLSFAPAYLRVGDGARILADNGATVDLGTTGSLYMNGAIVARGGDINLSVLATPRGTALDRGYLGTQSLWLGPQALLDGSATIERADDASGRLFDLLFDAGSIRLTAERGFIVAEPGSLLDVSSTQRYQVGLPGALSFTANRRHAWQSPAAGDIAITAADGINVFSTLAGRGNGDGLSGSISYTLDGNRRIEEIANNFVFFPLELHVAQTQSWSALQPGAALPLSLRGKAYVSTDAIAAGGFSSLTLNARNKYNAARTALSNAGSIVFDSDIDFALSDALTLGTTNLDIAGHDVNLSAGVLTLGSSFWESGLGVAQIKQATSAGDGRLTLRGKMLDVVGNVGISGVADTQLVSAGDLRLRAIVDGVTARSLAAAELTQVGDLTLRAAQIYPTTLSDYTLRLTGTDSVLTTLAAGARTPLLSAGGKLTLQAPVIEHGGVLAAPLGGIALNAGRSLHLATGSVVDVSAYELLIPFGRLRGGELNWIYPILGSAPLVIDSPPEKSVVLSAPSIAMDTGATIDVSGGGDIRAFEQIPGPGGSKDFLDPGFADGAFAVVPWLNTLTAPYDTVEMQGSDIALGTTIWLEGGNGLPAGNYAVLPAHYALLEGAYLITPTGISSPIALPRGQRIDGTVVTSGRLGRGYSEQYAAQWQSFAIETGAAARLRSEYKEMTGNQFFAGNKVDLATDAGRIQISAQTALALQGSINATAQNGRGAQLDILADQIEVVADAAQQVSAGAVKLVASALNSLGVDSLMLGGSRSRDGDNTAVDVRSSSVRLADGAALRGADVILVARDSISVGADASVTGSGDSAVNTRAFVIDGDGALLRASSAGQSNVLRENSTGATGVLEIAASAKLAADRSLLLDASSSMSLPGMLAVDGGSLNISANRISLGEVPAGTSGVALSNAQLSALQVEQLRLSSRSSLDFFGAVNFTTRQAELNTPLLRNMSGGDVRVSAGETLQLENGVNTLAATGSAGSGGALVLDATNILLGRDGDGAATMQLLGFDSAQLGAVGRTQSLRGAGDFTLQGQALTVVADSVSADSAGANTRLVASEALSLVRANAATASTAVPALGAALTLAGRSVDQGTRIALPSGSVTLQATGASGNVNVSGEIDVSGRSIALQHGSIETAGGHITLRADDGDVIAQAGSALRLSGANGGGDAGALELAASRGTVELNGALVADHVVDSAGGTLRIDAGTLGNADALLAVAMGAGISQRVELRARNGDVAIGQNIRAQQIALSADGGALTVMSTLDARGANGGSIALSAGGDLHLQPAAVLVAQATATNGRGGRVELSSRDGALQLGGEVAVGGGSDGRDGQLLLRVARSASNDSVPVVNNGIAVSGAERVQLAAYKNYDSNVVDAVLLDQARLDAEAFMLNESTIRTGLGSMVTDAFHLVPEIAVQSAGDLAVTTAVDFAADNDFDGYPDNTWRFGANGEAPLLTLRAGGNLEVGASISDGIYSFTDPNSFVALFAMLFGRDLKLLMSGDSASYRLVAGADFSAANLLATVDSGDLILSNGADIVTGSGSIALAAGGDIVVTAADSLIASLGKTTYTDYASPYAADGFPALERLPDSGTLSAFDAYFLAYVLPQYPERGGDVSLNAGGDIEFAEATKFASSWLSRVAGEVTVGSGTVDDPFREVTVTTWGILPSNMQEGVIAAGGGDVRIDAGNTVRNLNAALPSTGKQIGVGTNTVEIQRSGSLFVNAGGDILSARVLVDNGIAQLTAGGAIAASNTGLQTVAVLGDSTLKLRAGGDIGIDGVFNTTVMPQSANQLAPGANNTLENYFFTYGDASVSVDSLRGDILFNNDVDALLVAFSGDLPSHGNAAGFDGAFGTLNEQRVFALYPSRLGVAAASGDVRFARDLVLSPSHTGQLNIFAAGNIALDSGVRVRLSDVDPALLPTLYTPALLLDKPNDTASILSRLFGTTALSHAATAVHLHDAQPTVINALGDIEFGVESLFDLAEAAWIGARDLISASFSIQNNRGSDVSEIVAQRDILYPLIILPSGALQADKSRIEISGPGRLDVFAGRDIDLGTSEGFLSNGNSNNPNLPDSGADISVYAGINGATAFSDPTLFAEFANAYLNTAGGPSSGSYIDWFAGGNYDGDAASLLSVFTGKSYENPADALSAFAALPVLTRQAISLEAWRLQRADALASARSASAYRNLKGSADVNDYSADLIDFVSFERFGGDLIGAVSAVTQVGYASREEAAAALAALPAAQQHQAAKAAFVSASNSARRELLADIFVSEVRLGGVENQNGLIEDAARDGFERSYAAIQRMFPGDKWAGDISLVFSALRTFSDGDINLFAPGGGIDVGLAGEFAGFSKEAGDLGIITQRYGAINGFASGNININQSRISSLDGAGITLWSTDGDIDAGRGAKSALTIPPPKVKLNDDGSITLVFDAAVSGSGIQSARNNRKSALDRGAFASAADGATAFGDDGRIDRVRYARSLAPGSNYLFAPSGVIDAGDAGIAVEGNLLIAAQQVIGTDNINVGGISIGVPTTTSISAGTLSLGDIASSATESATSSMNDAIREAAVALAESTAAFVTVDIIGIGN